MFKQSITVAACVLIVWLVSLDWSDAATPQAARDRGAGRMAREAQRSAEIHWQRVPLRDALARLEKAFDETVFLDRRVDPSQRVSLDIEAHQIEDVLTAIAAGRGLGVSRLGRLVYLGPRSAADQLRPLAALRAEEMERLPPGQRATLQRQQPLHWPRLAQPRGLVTSLVEQTGWRVEQARRIGHDLWPAGGLPGLPIAEQLTVLLVGFDLTFELRPPERVIEIVPLNAERMKRLAGGAKPRAEGDAHGARPETGKTFGETRQVYTLRVAEQPVRAVLQELSRRLNWQIEIDEAAIRAAGRTADERVSFAVENVERDELLDALLRPAGLSFRRDDERITIVPGKSN